MTMRLHAERTPISYSHDHGPGSVVPMSEHLPVLAPELTSLLAPEPGQTAVDCTFGGGGHARLSPSCWGRPGR